MRLSEGSEVRVTCAHCGDHQWTVTVIEGRQRLECPSCRYSTEVVFTRDEEGGFRMDTNHW